jgi:transcription antitermination factor NusG
MQDNRFDASRPLPVGARVRINQGQLAGYDGRIVSIDGGRREVWFAVTVFDRPVELRLDFATAAQTLDVVPEDGD